MHTHIHTCVTHAYTHIRMHTYMMKVGHSHTKDRLLIWRLSKHQKIACLEAFLGTQTHVLKLYKYLLDIRISAVFGPYNTDRIGYGYAKNDVSGGSERKDTRSVASPILCIYYTYVYDTMYASRKQLTSSTLAAAKSSCFHFSSRFLGITNHDVTGPLQIKKKFKPFQRKWMYVCICMYVWYMPNFSPSTWHTHVFDPVHF